MTKLNDTQTILLSTAARRESGSLYPMPDTISVTGTRLEKAVVGLIDRGYAEERETSVAAEAHRSDGDTNFAVYATAVGLVAIGIDDSGAQSAGGIDPANNEPTPAKPKVERASKAALVLTLLQRDGGATLAELIEVTGWLPHTTRAALTGLRKKGHAIERGKRGDDTCYSVKAAA